jgi:large subunit ribosomal protein L1
MAKAEKNTKNNEIEKFVTSDINEAVDKVVELANAKKRKFVESIDLAINLGIDSKQSDQNVRGAVLLPSGSGKKVKVAVFTADEAVAKEAIEAGASQAGLDELVQAVQEGKINFDYCIATPDVMAKIGKIARVLGPRGLMPSPKNGSVTKDVKKAVEEALKGKVNFKNDKAGVIHCLVGKVDFSSKDLVDNIKEVFKVLKDSKPESSKGKFIKRIYLSATMSPSVEISAEAV